MKKLLATILALVMVFSLSVSALADDTFDTVPATSTGEVEVTVTEGVNDLTVYSVTVAWTDTEMEYTTEGEGTWNPSTHEYEGATENEWKDNAAAVTVTNHSNAAVTAAIAAADDNTLTYSFTPETFDLVTAEGTDADAAPSNTFTITAETAPTETVTDKFTVTISKPAEETTYDHVITLGTGAKEKDAVVAAASSMTVKEGETIYVTVENSTDLVAYLVTDTNGSAHIDWEMEEVDNNSDGNYDALVFTVTDTSYDTVILSVEDRVNGVDTPYYIKITVNQ